MSNTRSVAGVVVHLPEPVISDGHPSLPQFWARFGASATLKQGPLHIHAIADPNPIWDPRTGGWSVAPPPSGVGDYRWSVDTLPDPAGFNNGWYWLGDPAAADNTADMVAGGQQWAASPGSPGPAWRSFFPFKPSVSAYDAYIPGGGTVHHAKGVHFNSHYIEHMWLDFGVSQLQPCTWIVVATVMSDPSPGYQHNILDAGRNPDDAGFPRLGGADTSQERQIGDALAYRTRLAVQNNSASMLTRTGDAPLQTRSAPGHHPRMYAVTFNGTTSTLAVYDPFGQYTTNGTVSGGPAYSNRFTVIGREQGWISQRHASNMLVFEMRYWHHALVPDDLAAQYAQLSSTYQFDQYKSL